VQETGRPGVLPFLWRSCSHHCIRWLFADTGSVRSAVEPKQVMFSDGIRPGGDLTELDGVEEARSPVQASGRRTKKVDKTGLSLYLQTWQSRCTG